MMMKFYLKRFAGGLFARTKKELSRDYDLDCATTVAVVRVEKYREGIYGTGFAEHKETIRGRVVEAYKNGLTEIVD